MSIKMKPNTLALLEDLLSQGGAVMASQWTTGSGRYIKSKAIPPYSAKLDVSVALEALRGETLRTVKKIRRSHPNCMKIVAVTDLRAAKRASRQELS